MDVGNLTLPRLLAALQRRKILYIVLGYVSAGLAVVLAPAELYDALVLPEWAPRVALEFLIVGLPVTVVLAWAKAWERRSLEGSPQEAAIVGGEMPVPERSIVVLPFENASPAGRDAYLVDGVSEEIVTALTAIRALRVISMTSAFQYRDTEKDVGEIASDLCVRYVLEGSVCRAGQRLRITARLFDAAADTVVMEQTFPGSMAEIFEFQEQLVLAIVRTLSIRLGAEEERALSRRVISDVSAYELYLRAHRETYKFTWNGLKKAQRCLEDALRITGDNRALYGRLAHVHYQAWNMGMRLDEEDLRLARKYIDKASHVDPGWPDHLIALAILEVTGGSAVRALALLRKALERDPLHPHALGWYPGIASFLGLGEEATTVLERLRRVDPLNPFNWSLPPWIAANTGDFVTALALAEQERSSRQPDLFIESAYAMALAVNGRRTEAASVIRGVWRPDTNGLTKIYRTLACAFEGDREGVLRLIDRDLEHWARMDFAYSLWLAEALALSEEHDRAFEWLANSVERGNINYPYLSAYDPFLEPLRGTERFAIIMERAWVGWERWHAYHDAA